MLERKNRIRLNKEFDRAFKAGQSFYGKVFGFKVADNGLDISRFGLMVGLKVSKKAVVRNRLIRAIISKELPKIKEGKDVVIIVFNLILDKNFEEIETGIKMAFKKLNLYK